MKRFLFLFFTGAVCYPLIELLWRGRTHRSMALAGGICLCLMDKTCGNKRKHTVCFPHCILCAVIITVVEFVFGFFVNIIGKRKVWDYSNLPGNFMGQICLPFSVLWFFLSIPILWLCGQSRERNILTKKKERTN